MLWRSDAPMFLRSQASREGKASAREPNGSSAAASLWWGFWRLLPSFGSWRRGFRPRDGSAPRESLNAHAATSKAFPGTEKACGGVAQAPRHAHGATPLVEGKEVGSEGPIGPSALRVREPVAYAEGVVSLSQSHLTPPARRMPPATPKAMVPVSFPMGFLRKERLRA